MATVVNNGGENASWGPALLVLIIALLAIGGVAWALGVFGSAPAAPAESGGIDISIDGTLPMDGAEGSGGNEPSSY